jgi:hypothetical protein
MLQNRFKRCREASAQINWGNFDPDWGLYNGSMGTVIKIMYGEDENPNDGSFP